MLTTTVTLGDAGFQAGKPFAGPVLRYLEAMQEADRDNRKVTVASAELISAALARAGVVKSAEDIVNGADFDEIGAAAVAVLSLVNPKRDEPPSGETPSP